VPVWGDKALPRYSAACSANVGRRPGVGVGEGSWGENGGKEGGRLASKCV
jgi:hypothetical protein